MRVLVTYGLFEPTDRHVQNLRALAGDVVVAPTEPEALAAAPQAEVMLGHRFLRQCLPSAARLRWVQSTAGGVDRLPLAELRARGIQLTRITHAAPTIARHALTLAWAIQRRIPVAVQQQAAKTWKQDFSWLPEPRTAIVFGTGSIGRAIARFLKREGLQVIGVKRTITDEVFPEFDRLLPLSSAPAALSQADWCFIALPRNRESEGWFNAKTLQLLPSHAIIVNVGRGETIVTADLCAALRAGRLGGAALDVVDPKPGPDDPTWQTPHLLLTPHVAAHSFERQAQVERFAEEQVARYTRGEALLDTVELNSAETT
jgi:phosphoglycerate dehydrogenase-like enzyme